MVDFIKLCYNEVMVKMKIKKLMIGSLVGLLVVSVIVGAAMTPVVEMLKAAMDQSNPELNAEEPLWPDDEDEFARICGLR